MQADKLSNLQKTKTLTRCTRLKLTTHNPHQKKINVQLVESENIFTSAPSNMRNLTHKLRLLCNGWCATASIVN